MSATRSSTTSDSTSSRETNRTKTDEKKVFCALHNYTARQPDELSFKKGDMINLDKTGRDETDWYYGELNGRRGLFPKNYAEEIIELVRFEKIEFEILNGEELARTRIGCGATASVHKIRMNLERLSGRFSRFRGEDYFALKKFNAGFSDEPDSEQRAINTLKQEATIVGKFSHENIVQFLGYSIDHPFFGLVFEMCHGGSLHKLCTSTIDKKRSMPLDILVNWAGQIASGMEYLMKSKYIHRDLKADNVLVKQPSCQCDFNLNQRQCSRCKGTGLNYLILKIADFGGTRKITSRSVMSTVAGTYAWLAPETYTRNSYTEYSDVYSFGVVLWEILYRDLPYRGIMPAAVAFNVAQQKLKLEIHKNCPRKWAGIMQKCWVFEPKRRPTFIELVRDFEGYQEELKRNRRQILIPPTLKTEVEEIYGESLAPGSGAMSFVSRYFNQKLDSAHGQPQPVSSRQRVFQLKNSSGSTHGSMSSLFDKGLSAIQSSVSTMIDRVSGSMILTSSMSHSDVRSPRPSSFEFFSTSGSGSRSTSQSLSPNSQSAPTWGSATNIYLRPTDLSTSTEHYDYTFEPPTPIPPSFPAPVAPNVENPKYCVTNSNCDANFVHNPHYGCLPVTETPPLRELSKPIENLPESEINNLVIPKSEILGKYTNLKLIETQNDCEIFLAIDSDTKDIVKITKIPWYTDEKLNLPILIKHTMFLTAREYHISPILDQFCSQSEEEPKSTFLVTDNTESLKEALISGKIIGIDHRKLSYFLYQMLCAIGHLHEHGVIHQNLSTSSIIILDNQTFDCEIQHFLDFETPAYRAPDEGTDKMDIWSIGCIFAEVYTGVSLFPNGFRGDDGDQLEEKLEGLKGFQYEEVERNDMTASQAISLLSNMLKIDPIQRTSAREALKHPYIKSWGKNEEEKAEEETEPEVETKMDSMEFGNMTKREIEGQTLKKS